MILFSNFRKERSEGKEKVICDTSITIGAEKLPADTLWISTDEENGYFLNENICDGYLIAAMAFGMYYGQDVKIEGRVSEKLYYNLMNYGQQILINHDPGLQKINIEVDGFLADIKTGEVIGAPCSFGVDALTTLYDRWLCEEDEEKKINKVFSFNCGINGPYEDPNTMKLWHDRDKLCQKGFSELGLSIVNIDTNIHQFLHKKMFVYATACYLSRYFCILNLQGGVRRYYLPSGCSYQDSMRSKKIVNELIPRGSKDIGMGFEEPMMLPLLSTERLELVLDGSQYQKTEKTERISDWEFARRYLNVCQPGRQREGDLSRNCSVCPKCTYTMFRLDALGKLNLFSEVFDINKYYRNRFVSLCGMITKRAGDLLIDDALQFATDRGMKIPTHETVRKLNFFKWRFPDIYSYIGTVDYLCQKYKGKRLVVWGTGMVGSRVLAALNLLDIKVAAVVDSAKEKQGDVYFGYRVENYEKIAQSGDVILVCGIGICDEIKETVGERGQCVDVFQYRKNFLES